MSVTADLPDLNLWLALACPSIRIEGGEVVRILRNGARPVRSAIRRTDPWRDRFARYQRVVGLEQCGHSLQTASLVIHELSFGIQRLTDGRRKERFRSYLQNLRRLTGCSCSTGSLRHDPPDHH